MKPSQIGESGAKFSPGEGLLGGEGVTYCGQPGLYFAGSMAVAGRGGRSANKSETDPNLSMG